MSDAPVMLPDAPRGRVAAYALWQLRDFLVDRGLPTLIVSLLLGFLTAEPMKARFDVNVASLPARLVEKWGGTDAARLVMQQDFNERFLIDALGSFVFVGALLCVNGIVANDRKQGHYRFLFSKPVGPVRYYGQAFVLHCLGYVLLAALLLTLYESLLWPVMTAPLMQVIAIMFLFYASVSFMLSAAARWDWLSLVAYTSLGTYVWSRLEHSNSPLGLVRYLFPPLNHTGDIYAGIARGQPVDWSLLAWFGLYGLACYLIGLVVLRYRRMAVV